MSILDYLLRRKKKTANVAKERLQIILAAENINRRGPDFLPQLKQELLAVIAKYVDVNQDLIQVNLERDSDCDILELNIPLSSDTADKQEEKKKVAS